MNWKAKLTSRKFWVAVADFIGMLLVAFNYPQDKTVQITAIIMAGAVVIAYIIGEGLTDCANAQPPVFIKKEDNKEADDERTDKA